MPDRDRVRDGALDNETPDKLHLAKETDDATVGESFSPWPRLRLPGEADDPDSVGVGADTLSGNNASPTEILDLAGPDRSLEPANSVFHPSRASTTRESPSITALDPAPGTEAVRLAALNDARRKGRKIRRACRVAAFNATCSTICAGFSLLLAPVSVAALLAAVALGFIAWNEFRGRRALARLRPHAPMLLARNQMLFATLLVLYGCWGMYRMLAAPPISISYAEYGAEIGELMQPFDGVYRIASLALYAGVVCFGIVFQGGTAWYYASRRKYLAKYINETPGWIVRMQQHGHGM